MPVDIHPYIKLEGALPDNLEGGRWMERRESKPPTEIISKDTSFA
jgi:hypothetical protein